MIWGWLIPGWLRRAVAAAGVALVALWAAWVAGKREGRQQADLERLRGNVETRERMDDAPIADDPDAAREWLRRRDPRKP